MWTISCCFYVLFSSFLSSRSFQITRLNIRRKFELQLSSVISLPTQRKPSVDNFPSSSRESLSSYIINAPVSSREILRQKLTWQNKRYVDLGATFRSKYMKMRLLTEEEEKVAAKFCQVGKKLDRVKSSLWKVLGREPTLDEWAKAASLSKNRLQSYLSLSSKARHSLVEHNVRIVDYWCRKLLEHTTVGKEVSYYELMTEGIKGLSKAAENYDGTTKFFFYSSNWIRSHLYRGLSSLRPGSHANHRAALLISKSKRYQRYLEEKLQRPPTDEEIAAELNVKLKTYLAAKKAASSKSISAENRNTNQFHNGEASSSFLDSLASVDRAKVEIEKSLWKADFIDSMSQLSPSEKRALAIRYGLNDGIHRTVDKTAVLMCMSNESARLLLDAALEKMRNASQDLFSTFAEPLSNSKVY